MASSTICSKRNGIMLVATGMWTNTQQGRNFLYIKYNLLAACSHVSAWIDFVTSSRLGGVSFVTMNHSELTIELLLSMTLLIFRNGTLVWHIFFHCPVICLSSPVSPSFNHTVSQSVHPFICLPIHLSVCLSICRSVRHAGSYFARPMYILISMVLSHQLVISSSQMCVNVHCISALARFYQLLALYIFFLICFSIAILLRPLEVSFIFVSHGEKR